MAVTTNAIDRTVPNLKCLFRIKTEIPMIKFGFEYVMQLISGFKVSSKNNAYFMPRKEKRLIRFFFDI